MNSNTNSVMEKIKEIVAKGNVSRVLVRKDDKVLLNIPVTVGIVGAVVGLSVAKWATLAAVLATVGFGCVIEIVKDNGEIVNVLSEEDSQKIQEKAADIVGDVKSAIEDFKKSDGIEVDIVVEKDAEEAPAEEAPAEEAPAEKTPEEPKAE